MYLAWFLAYAQLKRSSRATTLLIVFVMSLTFLNLIVVRGILVGLIQGVTRGYQDNYAGDVILTTLTGEDYIDHSHEVIETIKSFPQVKTYTYRYAVGAQLEGSYRERANINDDPDLAVATILGIDPEREEATTHLSKYLAEGRFLTPEDIDGIVLGANTIRRYLDVSSPNVSLLEKADIGDKIRVVINGQRKEVTIIGILKSKTDEVDFRAFMLDKTVRPMIGRSDYNVNEIAIRLQNGSDADAFKEMLIKDGLDKYARIQTWQDSLPKFVLDIQKTFAMLGNVIGSIGLVVASITIFIVIFINAITRRKYIGILKGIGISSKTIELAYVIQSFFYAMIGIAIGTLILYGFLVPFVNAHPLKFPFSDGILVAEVSVTLNRILLLLIATLIAGYIPARLVVKQNTLNAILGRK
jgi:ABC-type lipoprotein release transport system permease subunit